MELYKFQSQVGGQDSYAIRARQLDENFSRLQPQTNGTYGINETANGWSLDIFPAFPQSATQALYLTYDGSLQWRTLEQNGDSGISPGAISGGAFPSNSISPGAVGSLYITALSGGTNVSTWSDPPPTGVAAWRQVERCDGKTMYVWGTEWAD